MTARERIENEGFEDVIIYMIIHLMMMLSLVLRMITERYTITTK